jgi:hypothetical protein
MADLNRPPAGGGSQSTVGSRRSRSAAGVGSTSPNPSGRNGSGLAPTRQLAPTREVADGRVAGRGCG